ncbi:T9SS type A sorting domain-containing protein [Fulvivirga sp. M361]|uniref:FG-GAP-like repeat-containing protein n=1 Tax=Fulvivirga sp. M361 TaxID=2594266 RepID=UPI001179C58B|nr:FG-GAP-like repeat-containing protein [Fulvivirga sp. M361]TRX60178.1 T9SS type A sorting domain-containing protein [Fulvivirga sp. M361]
MKNLLYASEIILFITCIFFFNQGNSQTFTNVSGSSGISHSHISSNLFGGGVAIFDYNNDGFEDIYLTGGTRQNKLYRNIGDGTFEDVSGMAGIVLKETIKTSGVIAGDINNNGLVDLFVTTESLRPNLLYINQGNGTFLERSNEAGITGNVWSTGAAFSDVNRDGLLDIYVVNYIKETKLIRNINGEVIGFDHGCYADQFYINNGDGTFTESAASFGIDNEGCGLAVAFTDYNHDTKPDIYIANDFGGWLTPNTLYENQYPQTTFHDKSKSSGLNARIYGMGIAVGDINNDGKFDYYSTNLGKNVLYENQNDNTFKDITDIAGVGNEFEGDLFSTSWGANFFDYDLDGYQDLFVANGHTPAASFIKNAEKDPNKLFKNSGDNTFEDVSENEGVADYGIARGSATFDYDNDGDMDLIITSLSRSSGAINNTLLYNNNLSTSNHWLKIKLEGTTSNRSAIGSKVVVYQQDNLQIRELSGGSGHASHNSSILHFGLGSSQLIDSIKVIWPGIHTQVFKNFEANESYHILEGSDKVRIIGCMQTGNDYYNPKASYNNGCKVSTITSIIDEQWEDPDFTIFPNPILTQGTVRFNRIAGERNISLIIFDAHGRVVYQHLDLPDATIIKKDGLSSGSYFYKAYSALRILGIGRLMIQD